MFSGVSNTLGTAASDNMHLHYIRTRVYGILPGVYYQLKCNVHAPSATRQINDVSGC